MSSSVERLGGSSSFIWLSIIPSLRFRRVAKDGLRCPTSSGHRLVTKLAIPSLVDLIDHSQAC